MRTRVVNDLVVELRVIGMHADMIIAMPFVLMLSICVHMLLNLEIIVVTAVLIGLEFTVKIVCAVKVLAGAMIGGASDIGTERNANSLSAIITALNFGLPAPLEESFLCCLSPFSCSLMTIADCPRSLQTCKPSDQVCSSLAPPALPQFPNQEPPRPQQLILPDFFVIPHLTHVERIVVIVADGWYRLKT